MGSRSKRCARRVSMTWLSEALPTQSSASTTLTYMPAASRMPVLTAPPWPLFGWWIALTTPGCAAWSRSASSGVVSDDPSSTMSTWMSPVSGVSINEATQRSRYCSMLYAGTTNVSVLAVVLAVVLSVVLSAVLSAVSPCVFSCVSTSVRSCGSLPPSPCVCGIVPR